MTKFYTILLLALFTLGLKAQEPDYQAWKVAYFNVQEKDMDARINYPIADPNGRTCAIIKVETPYTGFTFDTGTLKVVKAVQKAGEIWVYVPKGVRKITIGHQRGILREYQLPLTIAEATVYVLKLVEADGGAHFGGDALASQGFVVIESEPSGADVFVNDEWVGETPYQALYLVGTRFNFKVKKAMYHDDFGTATVSDTQNKYMSVLRPAFGSLRVESIPSGASVSIDGVVRGITPVTIDKVPSGEVTITLKKDLYSPATKTVTVSDGKQTTVTQQLDSRYGTLNIEAGAGSSIYINGEHKGVGSVSVNVVEGIYEIVAKKDYHRDHKIQASVVKYSNQNIKLSPTPIFGQLAVQSTPVGAEIYVDDVRKGVAPNIVKDVLIGPHKVTLRKDGYYDFSTNVELKEGSMENLNCKMQERRTTVSQYGSSTSTGSSSTGKVTDSYSSPTSTTTTSKFTPTHHSFMDHHGYVQLDLDFLTQGEAFATRMGLGLGYKLGGPDNRINFLAGLHWYPAMSDSKKATFNGLSSLSLMGRVRFNFFKSSAIAIYLEPAIRGDLNYVSRKHTVDYEFNQFSAGVLFDLGLTFYMIDFAVYAGYNFAPTFVPDGDVNNKSIPIGLTMNVFF